MAQGSNHSRASHTRALLALGGRKRQQLSRRGAALLSRVCSRGPTHSLTVGLETPTGFFVCLVQWMLTLRSRVVLAPVWSGRVWQDSEFVKILACHVAAGRAGAIGLEELARPRVRADDDLDLMVVEAANRRYGYE